MNKEEIEKVLRRILIEDFAIAAEKITADATFRGTLGMDSMDAVDLIMLVHREFGFKTSVEAYRNLNTVGSLVDFVHKTTSKAAQEA